MSKSMKWFSLIGLFGWAFACTQAPSDGNLAVFHSSLVDDAKTMDPINAYDGISLEVVPNIYESLYQYAYVEDTYRVVPSLAADLPKVSKDRLTVTIPLRQDIHFQDDPCFKDTQGKGRRVVASDFVYGLKRLADPRLQAQGYWVIDGKVEGIAEFQARLAKASGEERKKIFEEPVSGLKALNDSTFQIKLTKPYPQLVYVLTMALTTAVAREAVEAYGDENGNLTDHPVGTGAFILKEWKRGHRIVLERNPNFHPEFYPTTGSASFRKSGMLTDAGKKMPFVDRAVFHVMREQQPAWLSFLKSELDVTLIPKDSFKTAMLNTTSLAPEIASRGIRLNVDTGSRFYFISFNVKDPVLSNKLVRQAMSLAIDRDKWIELFTNGRGQKMVHSLPPGLPGRPEKSRIKYDFDLAKAKDLLKKAGYPEGRGMPVVKFDLRGAGSVDRQLGDFFSQQWAQIGVKAEVILNTFPAYLEKSKQGQLQMAYNGWGLDYPDAENVYQLVYGPNKSPGPNDTLFNRPDFDRTYEQIAVMENGAKRTELIRKMDETLQEEVPWAYGFYHADFRLSHPWVLNYRANEMIQNRLKYYRIDLETKKRYRSQ